MFRNRTLWQVEGACRDAWPANEELDLDGWRLRLSRIRTRRNNSLNPLGSIPLSEAHLDWASDYFRSRGRDLTVRVPSFLTCGSDQLLNNLGFRKLSPTLTLAGKLVKGERHPHVIFKSRCDADWAAARQRMSGESADEIAAFQSITGLIEGPTCFAERHEDGEIVSLAYGAIILGTLVVEAVLTDPDHRGKGYARDVSLALARWAREQKAKQVCLQVVEANEAARKLYAGIGLDKTLYSYHYRSK